jgi:hypothetical protein
MGGNTMPISLFLDNFETPISPPGPLPDKTPSLLGEFWELRSLVNFLHSGELGNGYLVCWSKKEQARSSTLPLYEIESQMSSLDLPLQPWLANLHPTLESVEEVAMTNTDSRINQDQGAEMLTIVIPRATVSQMTSSQVSMLMRAPGTELWVVMIAVMTAIKLWIVAMVVVVRMGRKLPEPSQAIQRRQQHENYNESSEKKSSDGREWCREGKRKRGEKKRTRGEKEEGVGKARVKRAVSDGCGEEIGAYRVYCGVK